jgi:hypothetical protein
VVVTWPSDRLTCGSEVAYEADCAGDSTIQTNHMVTHGPIIGNHMAPWIRPMLDGQNFVCTLTESNSRPPGMGNKLTFPC